MFTKFGEREYSKVLIRLIVIWGVLMRSIFIDQVTYCGITSLGAMVTKLGWRAESSIYKFPNLSLPTQATVYKIYERL